MSIVDFRGRNEAAQHDPMGEFIGEHWDSYHDGRWRINVNQQLSPRWKHRTWMTDSWIEFVNWSWGRDNSGMVRRWHSWDVPDIPIFNQAPQICRSDPCSDRARGRHGCGSSETRNTVVGAIEPAVFCRPSLAMLPRLLCCFYEASQLKCIGTS